MSTENTDVQEQEQTSTEAQDNGPVIGNVHLTGEDFTPSEKPQPEASNSTEQPEKQEASSSAPASPEANSAPAAPENNTQASTQSSAPESQAPEPQAPIDPYEVLGLGEHKEYAEKLLAALKSNSLTEFLNKTTVDYDKVDDKEILRIHLSEKYPNATPEQLNILVKRDLVSLGITGDDDTDADGHVLLKLETDKIREGLKEAQKNYAPPTIEPKPNPIDQQQELARKQFEDFIDKNPDLAAFERDRAISFGDFKPEVPADFNPRAMIKNPDLFWQQFDKPDGTIDINKLNKVFLIASNPDKYIGDAFNNGKSVQAKKEFDEIRNPETGASGVDSTAENGPKITNVRITSAVN